MLAQLEMDAPPEWNGSFVPLLDVLLHLRSRFAAGLGMELVIGDVTVFNFRKFEQGMAFYTECCGVGPGDEYRAFREWMTKSEWEPTSAGWMPTLLEKCNGDHRAAIRKYLDLAAELAEARRAGRAT